MTAPQLTLVSTLHVDVAAPVVVGETAQGTRRLIPILGGAATGRLAGRVLPGGADYQILRRDNVTELEARYVVETQFGLVYVVNHGLRHGPAEAMERLARGETVDSALIYFRAAPRFETAAAELQWLTRALFLCKGARHPAHVELQFYEVL
ncbi:MAG: DUF3237 domain-containing protein [Hyphomicrobiales bacterium]|nr:DUF3237 domain-containing protein [Hyphomicrobiales bacterium]